MPRRSVSRFVEAEKIDESLAAPPIAKRARVEGLQFLKGKDAIGDHIIKKVWIYQGRYGKRVVLETDRGLLRLNKLSVRECLDVFGPNAKDWIGKWVVAEIEQMDVRGEVREVLMVRPCEPRK